MINSYAKLGVIILFCLIMTSERKVVPSLQGQDLPNKIMTQINKVVINPIALFHEEEIKMSEDEIQKDFRNIL